MNKRTNNNLQNITHKTKDRATRTPPKFGSDIRCSGRESSSCSTCGNIHVNTMFVARSLIFFASYVVIIVTSVMMSLKGDIPVIYCLESDDDDTLESPVLNHCFFVRVHMFYLMVLCLFLIFLFH